ncbi:MAG: ATP-binding protein [Eubacteriales bacterium]|nr:ATP-binding protein [Eubacteriales bacterium]
MVNRDTYLNQLIHNMWNGEVKVITGIRRCGKSVLLFDLFHDYLLSQGVKEDHILTIKLDQRKYLVYRDPVVLCDYVEGLISAKKEEKFYLFIDEVQMANTKADTRNPNSKVTIYDMLNELRDYPNLDVYVTGSNSKGLAKDIATEFRGRATQIPVYPLSFSEFYSAFGGEEEKALNTYVLFGGMPRLLSMSDEREKKSYLSDLFRLVYLKDIEERNRVEREDVLGEILDYLASQIGTLTNPNSIARYLNSIGKEKINANLITRYLQIIEDSFLLAEAKRFDVKGKRYFDYPSKYYFTDLGLRNARLNFRQFDSGQLMENLIYNELVRRGYSVDVGVVLDRRDYKDKQKEIDFVINDADRRVYIQWALAMNSKEKEEAELSPFFLTGDFFTKIIIQKDIPTSYYDEKGIFHMKLMDFLLNRIKLF